MTLNRIELAWIELAKELYNDLILFWKTKFDATNCIKNVDHMDWLGISVAGRAS